MDIAALINATAPIPVHAYAAFFALAVGAAQLLRAKGTASHRLLGYAWVGAMAFVALSSFFIHEYRWVGPFGPIHLLSALVLFSLVGGILAIRRGDVAKHRATMRSLYFYALIVAGAFTFLPGRIMHDVLTGGA